MPIINISVDSYSASSTRSMMVSWDQVTSWSSLRERISAKCAVGPIHSIRYEHNGSNYSMQDEEDFNIWCMRVKGQDELSVHIQASNQPSIQDRAIARPRDSLPGAGHGGATMRSQSPQTYAEHNHPQPQHQPRSASSGLARQRLEEEYAAGHAAKPAKVLVGQFAHVPNVRMLYSPENHKGIYVCRDFAVEHHLIPATTKIGTYAYQGLIALGEWPISVGGKTFTQSVKLTENHDDEGRYSVILGRSWAEKWQVKKDSHDDSMLGFIDTAEQLECEIIMIHDLYSQKISK